VIAAKNVAVIFMLAALAGCRRAPVDQERLPEDPVLAAMASAQWRAHLAAEERERKLAYDRRKLDDHRTVVALLQSARDRYDRATTRRAVEKARAEQLSTLATVRELVQSIDPWGVNSNVLDDYAAMLSLLGADYPAARKASIDGNPGPLEKVRSNFDAREKTIAEWLDEAASSVDDGDGP
jgi:hypothetical protein